MKRLAGAAAILLIVATSIAHTEPATSTVPPPQGRTGTSNRVDTPGRGSNVYTPQTSSTISTNTVTPPPTSFWTTTLGLLTALTGFLGACAALIAALRNSK
jgi:hypothetical protein